jgi:hypothetical protein
VNSKLIKLEREITTIANQMNQTHDNRRRLNKTNFFRIVQQTKQQFAVAIAFCSVRGKISAAWIRKLFVAAIRGVTFSSTVRRKRPVATLDRPASPESLASGDVGRVGVTLVSVCLGLVSLCAVVAILLFVQVRGLKTDLAQMGLELAATKATVTQFEKIARQISNGVAAADNRNIATTQPKQPPLVLDITDIQTIRQFITVTPPQLGARHDINVGDEVRELPTRPIPDLLADALPKLRGARFSIAQDSAIILIGAGSNRVDAVIGYR